jgi:hypothetical protein
MKKIIISLFAVAIASANVVAQEPPPGKGTKKTAEERAENMTARLTKELDLNADQAAKAKAIILKREQDRDKLQEQMKGEREKMEEQMKKDHEKVKAEFKEFLSSEQYKKFEAKDEEMRKKHEERRQQQQQQRKSGQGPPKPEGK